jgi:hypothetical protein
VDTWHLPPPRVLIAIGVTAVAVLVLGLRTCAGGDGGVDGTSTTTSTASTLPAEPDDGISTTTSSIVVLPDWYPKQSSRYSDREPVVTVTTLPPTSSTTTTEPEFDSGDAGDND